MLECPFCHGELEFLDDIELELPGKAGSVYTYQWLKCKKCMRAIYGEQEEFLNAFDDDIIHLGYIADPEKWESSLKELENCPNTKDKYCKCVVHEKLRSEGLPGSGEMRALHLKSYEQERGGKKKYTVFVDDNFHHMDESERYRDGEFDDYEEALAACKKIVDDFLLENYKAGVTDPDELYKKYTTYGEDPFIIPSDKNNPFSAWKYAKERSVEICRQKKR